MTYDDDVRDAMADAANYPYGGDLDDHLGPDWRDLFVNTVPDAIPDGTLKINGRFVQVQLQYRLRLRDGQDDGYEKCYSVVDEYVVDTVSDTV